MQEDDSSCALHPHSLHRGTSQAGSDAASTPESLLLLAHLVGSSRDEVKAGAGGLDLDALWRRTRTGFGTVRPAAEAASDLRGKRRRSRLTRLSSGSVGCSSTLSSTAVRSRRDVGLQLRMLSQIPTTCLHWTTGQGHPASAAGQEQPPETSDTPSPLPRSARPPRPGLYLRSTEPGSLSRTLCSPARTGAIRLTASFPTEPWPRARQLGAVSNWAGLPGHSRTGNSSQSPRHATMGTRAGTCHV